VNPVTDNDPPGPRICINEKNDYAKSFENLYDRFPAHLQKMFCHLERIYIEKDFVASAYGGLFEDPADENHILGGMIGLREEFLKNPVSLNEWASWKEQIHFGADPKKVIFSTLLPRVETSMKNDSIDMLYFLVAHEFGHIFDYTNNLNNDSCPENSTAPQCKQKSWHFFSWANTKLPKPANDFPLLSDLCYYFCDGHFIPSARQDELYKSLNQTNFLTPYTTRNPYEDFADTFAIYTIMTDRGSNYVIKTPDLSYDATSRLRSPVFEGKRNFIKDFLSSSYKYPGDN
jgi:hypothetical protein